jgi:O-glycosyl hydrolase
MRKYILHAFVMIGLIFSTMAFDVNAQVKSTNPEMTVRVDGSIRLQTIDGFGVNANTESWNGDELKPALDILLDSMNSTLWRVMVEVEKGGEDVNDNDDPFKFNWDFYNKLYETPHFQKVWNTVEYLNRHGITNGVMLNYMGRAPEWMGQSVIKPEYEDEFVEMQVSFLLYAKNVKHLLFGLFSPMNETDIKNEGPTVKADQFARILRKLVDRMQQNGLGNVKIVSPDAAGMRNAIRTYLPAMLSDPVIMKKIAHWGMHSYGGYNAPVDSFIKKSSYPKINWWLTEFNAWRNGLDAGKTDVKYDYKFASESVNHLLQLLKNGASGGIIWEGYDSYYQHPPGGWSLWGVLGYDRETKTYKSRKHLPALAQITKFVLPGSRQIGVNGSENKNITLLAFNDTITGRITLTGINRGAVPLNIMGTLANLPELRNLEMFYTDSVKNLFMANDIPVRNKMFKLTIPSKCLFTLTGKVLRPKPEPSDWFAGDMHVHRNCGEPTGIFPDNKLTEMMEKNDLAVVSMLADMGNGEVKDSKEDLVKVNGTDAKQSIPGRIVHWDAEWHYDPAGVTFENQAIGGHLAVLGLKEAHQIWDESAYKIVEWAKKQNAVSGFVHMEYLNDAIQNKLTCCIPLDYPVEAALGTIDFVAEDVWQNDASIHGYYKLLNCGFRIGLAAGTDVPCMNGSIGDILTYVQVKDNQLTYAKWIEGIKNGRTVIALNGHKEFLDLKVNATNGPGDVIKIKGQGDVRVSVKWTTVKELAGNIELICNGKVVASKAGTAKPGAPVVLNATQKFLRSGWLCARRMDSKGHISHTAPVYIAVNEEPVRASVEDAQYFVRWIDNMITNISSGGTWNKYFTHDLDVVKARYEKAKDIYVKIEDEAIDQLKNQGNGILENGSPIKLDKTKRISPKKL